MPFDDSLLVRTPAVLRALLEGLPDAAWHANEGPGTWSPFDVIGHLIHGEHADWIPRARRILDHGESLDFDPFDREAQFRESEGKTPSELLVAFANAREESLTALRAMKLTDADLARTGTHPAFGRVTLGQLLATWVTHDLDHIAQVARVLAKRNAEAVGPWSEYLSILRDRRQVQTTPAIPASPKATVL
ncbi:MAG: DinB family protein [Acidobacteria bacterium]|nr:DinB family protein [Acidobacteriota bacterium]